MVPITALYAALAALIIVALSLNVALGRLRHHVSIGDGNHPGMMGAMRAHGNAIEYLPIGLLVMMALELEHGSVILLHIIGAMLVLGRILHAFGMLRSTGTSSGRVLGYSLTTTAILLAAVALLVQIALFSGALTMPH